MAKYGRGLICLALDSLQAKRLNLSLMSPINQSRNKTAFTISIEAKKGITTGISAKDRAKTIKIASKKNVNKKDIVSPGHVFPIIAKDGPPNNLFQDSKCFIVNPIRGLIFVESVCALQ